jgi:hypothetical protein
MVHMGGRTRYLDVVITNQSCPSQLAQHHSDTVTDAANIDKERLKSLHYRDWIENVVPIAIEATGRFGPSALKYITSVTQQMGKAKAMYLQEIQCAIAKLNGQMFTKFLVNLKTSGTGVPRHICQVVH